jgi:hypothetical protein
VAIARPLLLHVEPPALLDTTKQVKSVRFARYVTLTGMAAKLLLLKVGVSLQALLEPWTHCRK